MCYGVQWGQVMLYGVYYVGGIGKVVFYMLFYFVDDFGMLAV